MPTQIVVSPPSGVPERAETLSVATEQELLDFANMIRKAGGTDILPALLPSIRSAPNECLIANALNFDCSVDSNGKNWYMCVSEDIGRQIADNTDLRVLFEHSWELDAAAAFVQLPEHIGNAAYAFDRGEAFQHLVDKT